MMEKDYTILEYIGIMALIIFVLVFYRIFGYWDGEKDAEHKCMQEKLELIINKQND